jgi:transposase-like protein
MEMETEGPWCDNASCPDCGKIGADNITMHSYAERRLRCTTCHRTCSADKGTFFETLRTPRPILLDVVAMLVERNSLRAVSRIKHCKTDAALHWLDLAGQQGAAVHRHLVRDVHPTQVQVDELWSFVKKNKSTCNQATQLTGVTPGCGVRSPCRGISAS